MKSRAMLFILLILSSAWFASVGSATVVWCLQYRDSHQPKNNTSGGNKDELCFKKSYQCCLSPCRKLSNSRSLCPGWLTGSCGSEASHNISPTSQQTWWWRFQKQSDELTFSLSAPSHPEIQEDLACCPKQEPDRRYLTLILFHYISNISHINMIDTLVCKYIDLNVIE